MAMSAGLRLAALTLAVFVVVAPTECLGDGEVANPVPGGEVIVLSDQTFDSVTGQFEIVLVNFYADWCRFSQMLKPIFSEAARVMADNPNVRLGSINCEAGDTVVSREKYHINKYPTIKVFRRGIALKAEYRGQRSPQAMKAFVEELLREAVADVNGDDDINDHVNRHHRAVIGHFENTEQAEHATFMEVAHKLRDECHFLKYIGSPQGTAVTFKSRREDIRLEGEIEKNSLFDWAREQCNPIVREITFENGEELTEEGLPFLILFYNPDDHAPVDEFTQIIKQRFTSERGNINFITADGHKFSHPLRHLGKTKKDLPVLAFDTFKHMYLFKKFSNIRKAGKLEKFVADLHSGKLHHKFHHPGQEDESDNDDEEDTVTASPGDELPKEADNVVDTIKEKLEVAEKQKRPEVPKELMTTEHPEAPEQEEEHHDDPSKPVPVKSVLKNLKPSQNRYSFAHNRDEL